jgi:hypothetical protein
LQCFRPLWRKRQSVLDEVGCGFEPLSYRVGYPHLDRFLVEENSGSTARASGSVR